MGGSSARAAATLGAGERLRPILMTACAMTMGMVPMALALEEGSQMQAPLGRAVIGGLVMSTFATLLVIPSIFAVVIGGRSYRSPSIYPDDRDGRYYDPDVFTGEDREKHAGAGRTREATPHEIVTQHNDDEIMGFLRSMLHEIRQKRHEMVTHQSTDDLLGPLGFEKQGPDGRKAPEANAGKPPDARAPGENH
jgi:hypothetical protein